MLLEIRSPNEKFKTIRFKPGFNLLIAEKGAESTDADSRNGAGKSSVIEVLHFLLGLNRFAKSVLRKDAIQEYAFVLTLEWSSVPWVSVARSLSKRSQLILQPNVVGSAQLVTTAGTVKNAEWLEALGDELFSLPADHTGLSTRTLLNFYIRRDSQDGFTDPVVTVPRQSVTDASTNLSYLLGLNWRLISEYQGIAARERLRKELKKATQDPSFGFVVGTASELRGQIQMATRRVEELTAELGNFAVVPEYEAIQRQADAIDETIRGSRLRDAADRRNLQDLEKSNEADTEPSTDYVEKVYEELGIALPEMVVRTYEEVRRFHDSVAQNRRLYLEAEIAATRLRLDGRAAERRELGVEHSRLLGVLSSGGALDAYSELANRLSTARAHLETLESRLETAKRLEATQAEIKIERLTLRQQIRRELDERAVQVNEINDLFQRFAASLYSADREAYIEIDPLDSSLRIRPHIGGEESRGIGQMTMFCFDLTWAVIAHRGGRGPDFLVHDSHLFDGVDERQVSRAFQLAVRVCEEEGMQYVVTMNSDDLAKAEGFGFDAEPYIIEPRLTDAYEDGGLFGVQFV